MCCCEMVPLQTASWKVLDSSIYTFLLLCVSMFREMHKNRLNRGNAILEIFSSLNLNLMSIVLKYRKTRLKRISSKTFKFLFKKQWEIRCSDVEKPFEILKIRNNGNRN